MCASKSGLEIPVFQSSEDKNQRGGLENGPF